jgi:serine/threonine protein kinase
MIPIAMQEKHTLESVFRREIKSMKAVWNHPCVVPFVGYSLPSENSRAMIMTDFMPNGSLRDVMNENPRPIWWTPTIKAISIYRIVRGMEFAHSKGIIHRDLNPNNLLFDSEYHLRINDFKSSRANSGQSTFTQRVGNPNYVAPEMYQDGTYDSAVDVFSFGLIMYEILCDKPAFANVRRASALMAQVLSEVRPEIPKELPQWVIKLIQRCWNTNPAYRPRFETIANVLIENNFQVCNDVEIGKVAECAEVIDSIVAQLDSQRNLCDD